MIYEYLITLCKLIVGLVSRHPQSIIYASLICFGAYILWIIVALVFSFQRKFYANSAKMYDFIKKTENLTDCNNFMKKKVKKMSVGFIHGWKKFESAKAGKPSDFISRNEALDSEVSGGLFNQGKSIMKSFIWITTIFLTVINIAYHGAENVITFMMLSESLVLPIIYYIVMKTFYYLYTVIRQQLYKLDIDSFYELIDVLDERFEKADLVISNNNAIINNVEETNNTITELESSNINDDEIVEESENKITEEIDSHENVDTGLQAEESLNQESNEVYQQIDEHKIQEETELENSEDEILNEVPESSASIAYINLDNNYIINDDERTFEEETEEDSDLEESVENEISEDFSVDINLDDFEINETTNFEDDAAILDETAVEDESVESDIAEENEPVENYEYDKEETKSSNNDFELEENNIDYDDDNVDASSDEINDEELASIIENFNAEKEEPKTEIHEDDTSKIIRRNTAEDLSSNQASAKFENEIEDNSNMNISSAEDTNYNLNTEAIKKVEPVKSSVKTKPENIKQKSKREEDMSETLKKRGRPKKPVFDEEVTINSSEEFNAALARAEKLMRKSEEGLSASQSKRIEKELKMLMEAMNKYKESR